jgi:uncharacterized membrane protein
LNSYAVVMFSISSILEAMRDPAMRHSAFVHIPLAMAWLGIALAVVAALLHKHASYRVIAIGFHSLMVAACFITVNSGEAAHDAISRALSNAQYELVEQHEELAEKLWLFAGSVVALLIISAYPKRLVRHSGAWLAVAASIANALWAAEVGHLGGTLVYVHGVGVQQQPHGPPSDRPSRPERNDIGSFDGRADDSTARDPRIAFFQDHVKPILADHCFKCHNPAKAAARKSGRLDQTSREGLLTGGRSGPSIVVGQPEKSLLIKRVRHVDPEDDPMPPPPNAPLREDEILILEQWIRDGALWGD